MHQLIPGSQFEIIEGTEYVRMWNRPKTFHRHVLEFRKAGGANVTDAAAVLRATELAE